MTIDAVIPTYHPDGRFLQIVKGLSEQSVTLRCLRVINTDRDGLIHLLERSGITEERFLEQYPFLSITHILPEEFDHGGTRNRGFLACEGADFVLTMTQDAVPKDKDLVRNLLMPFIKRTQENPYQAESVKEENADRIVVTYARQLPCRDASCEERLSRAFNYPEESRVKSERDLQELGVKTYFCSNVCAMYRMETWRKLGGFPQRAIFNEDMIYAGKALQAGYTIRYTAEACVYHSHSYTASQQFHRNFDLGVSQTQNPQVFGGISSEGEGLLYVKAVCTQLRREHMSAKIPGFIVRCAARLAGYRMGKKYEHLPKSLTVRCSSNKNYWKHP